MKENTMLEKITGVVFLILVGIAGYYALYPFKPIELHSIGIDKDSYCIGEYAKIEMNFTKNMDIQAEVTWYIVDGIVYQLDSPGISRPSGVNNVIVSKRVPLSLNPGTYNFRVEMKYEIHPIRSPIHIAWDTPLFEVVDCDTQPTGSVNVTQPVQRTVTPDSMVLPNQNQTEVIVNPVQTNTAPSEPSNSKPEPKTPTPSADPKLINITVEPEGIIEKVLEPITGLLKR